MHVLPFEIPFVLFLHWLKVVAGTCHHHNCFSNSWFLLVQSFFYPDSCWTFSFTDFFWWRQFERNRKGWNKNRKIKHYHGKELTFHDRQTQQANQTPKTGKARTTHGRKDPTTSEGRTGRNNAKLVTHLMMPMKILEIASACIHR